MTKAQLLESAKSLPAGERIDLVMELWDSLEPISNDLPTSPSLRQELRRRLAEDEANPAPAQDWSQLREKLLRGEI